MCFVCYHLWRRRSQSLRLIKRVVLQSNGVFRSGCRADSSERQAREQKSKSSAGSLSENRHYSFTTRYETMVRVIFSLGSDNTESIG